MARHHEARRGGGVDEAVLTQGEVWEDEVDVERPDDPVTTEPSMLSGVI